MGQLRVGHSVRLKALPWEKQMEEWMVQLGAEGAALGPALGSPRMAKPMVQNWEMLTVRLMGMQKAKSRDLPLERLWEQH